MKRAYSIKDLNKLRFKVMDFDGQWLASIGKPELSGSWIIWGNSGNGKTMFTLQLANYLSKFGRVLYDSLEEGISESLRYKVKQLNMNKGVLFIDKEPVRDLVLRLEKHKSPSIVIIDSLQYSGLNMHSYKELITRFGKKLFVWVSHAEGKYPAGRTAKSVRYDANVKIWVEKFVAYPQSRYGGGAPYVIWEEKAVIQNDIAV